MSDSRPVSGAGRPAGEPKEQINPRLPVEMVEELKALAEANKRTISAEVEAAVEAHLRRDPCFPPSNRQPSRLTQGA